MQTAGIIEESKAFVVQQCTGREGNIKEAMTSFLAYINTSNGMNFDKGTNNSIKEYDSCHA
jgi:hypothetical protein